MLNFFHPWVFWLAPLPWLVWWFFPRNVPLRPAVRVPFGARLKASGGDANSVANEHARSMGIRAVVWLLLLVALARPQWLDPPIERIIPTRDLLLLVDLSGSMKQEDFKNKADQPVDRLTATKEVLSDFLVRRKGDRVGLVVFGDAPFLQVPFTTDLTLCEQMLEETAIGMAGPRTALGDAIGLGIRLFENSGTPKKTIIALTDGNDTHSALPPAEAARVARDRDITIHTVAMGDPTTVGEEKLDQEALVAVAEEAHGKFFLAMNREELVKIYDTLDQIETREVKTVSHRPRHDLYFWPLAMALLVSLAAGAWELLSKGPFKKPANSALRLRVHPQTFELQAFEK